MALFFDEPLQPSPPTAYGTVFRLIPGRDAAGVPWAYGYEVQRAPDVAGAPGAPLSIYSTQYPLPASGGIFTDQLPAASTYYHYRFRHIGPGFDPGNWTLYLKRGAAPLSSRYSEQAIGAASVYPLRRDEALVDGDWAVAAAVSSGLQVVKEAQIEGQVRTLFTGLTWLVPNGEFEMWQSSSQPHAWSVDTGDSSAAAKDTGVVYSGDASAKFAFGGGGSAGTWRGITTNDPTKGAFCVPLRPGLTYRVIAFVRVSAVAAGRKARFVVTYNAGGTLTSTYEYTFQQSTTWERVEFTIQAPTAAEANSRIAVEFTRNGTGAIDFWIDSLRFEEEIASVAELIARLASAGRNVVLNGRFEIGNQYWENLISEGSLTLFEGAKYGRINNVVSSTTEAYLVDRSTDTGTTFPAAGGSNRVAIPAAVGDEVWVYCALRCGASSGNAVKVDVQELDATGAVLSTTNVHSKTGSSWAEFAATYVVASASCVAVRLRLQNVNDPANNNGGYIDDLRVIVAPLRYRAFAYKAGAAQSINNITETAISFDGERWDVGNLHDNVTNNTRFTVPAVMARRCGVRLFAEVEFDPNATGYRQVKWRKNGGTALAHANCPTVGTADATRVQCVARDELPAPGDYYEVIAYQNSGGALNINGGASLCWGEIIFDY